MAVTPFWPVLVGAAIVPILGYGFVASLVEQEPESEDSVPLAFGPRGRHRLVCFLCLLPTLAILWSEYSLLVAGIGVVISSVVTFGVASLPHRVATYLACSLVIVPVAVPLSWSVVSGRSIYILGTALTSEESGRIWNQAIADLDGEIPASRLDWIVDGCRIHVDGVHLRLTFERSAFEWDHAKILDAWVTIEAAVAQDSPVVVVMLRWHSHKRLDFTLGR